MITVTFGCGHTAQMDGTEKKQCPECGDKRVSSVKAPKPRFTGVK